MAELIYLISDVNKKEEGSRLIRIVSRTPGKPAEYQMKQVAFVSAAKAGMPVNVNGSATDFRRPRQFLTQIPRNPNPSSAMMAPATQQSLGRYVFGPSVTFTGISDGYQPIFELTADLSATAVRQPTHTSASSPQSNVPATASRRPRKKYYENPERKLNLRAGVSRTRSKKPFGPSK
ncbi:unnamed protein product [Orchesella dallaii]|uniref:Uncharacterized protein n=1 Tax=Orchesella dallaii TaxID=48710 RepID=A0ABP1RMV2_9HEXA